MMQTRFYIPRRMASIAAYVDTDSPSPIWKGAGEIQSGEATFNREVNNYWATSLAGNDCRRYSGYKHTEANSGTLVLEMMHNDFQILQAALSSALSTTAAGAAPSQTWADGAVSGDELRLDFIPDHTQTLDITDSDTGPTTLVEGTNFEWVAKKAGKLRLLDITGLVQPFKAAYVGLDQQHLNPMSLLDTYWMISLDGANEADSCKPERDLFYRCSMEEATVRRMHEPAETVLPVPQPASFQFERDPARGYEFGQLDQLSVAAA